MSSSVIATADFSTADSSTNVSTKDKKTRQISMKWDKHEGYIVEIDFYHKESDNWYAEKVIHCKTYKKMAMLFAKLLIKRDEERQKYLDEWQKNNVPEYNQEEHFEGEKS